MAFISSEIQMDGYDRTLPVELYFPTDLPAEVGNKVRGVVWLLHGYAGTGKNWMMYSAVPRYAADNGFVLIAPGAGNSFYSDMAFGAPWYTMLTEALPRQLKRIFNIPTHRESTYVCGLSMGGFGAVKLGFSRPDRFAAIGTFSGALDTHGLAHLVEHNPNMVADVRAVLGPDMQPNEKDDLLLLAQKAAALPKEQRPRIFQTCGTEDYLYDANQVFRNGIEQLNAFDYEYRDWPGVHEWNFWDRSVAEFFGWVQHNDYGERKKQDWQA